jgi:putative transposase
MYLVFFGSTEGEARRAYLVFVEEEMGIDRELELSGGGLVRSHGGWAESAVDAQTVVAGAG